MQVTLNSLILSLIFSLKAKHFKLQLSWSRIQPLGVGQFNNKGIQHYHNVIDAYQTAGITLLVELYHWDLPQPLQDLGGWLNPDIIKKYGAYADKCFKEYGNKVNIVHFMKVKSNQISFI